MPELKERFSLADEIGSRDLWAEARRRAAAPEAPPLAVDWPPATGRRLVAAAVALVVFATAAVFAWDLSHPERRPDPRPTPAVDLASELPEGWSELPAPPDVRRAAATAWTGSKLIVWGGYVYVLGTGEGPLSREGSVFDAGSRRWEPMAPGPLSARSAAASAWTGDEFLVWGGRASECCVPPEAFLGDGAAYDPAARRWRRLPEAPIEARAPLSVWTGDELIVWGSADRDLRFRDGAAYDPASNTWRQIADGPIELTDAVAVWSGEEMVVFGAALHGGGAPETETAIGAAYNPATDSWRELPPSLGSNPNANTAVWADGRLIAMDYDNDVETYEPSAGRWRSLAPMPLDDGEDVPSAAYVEGWVLARFFRGVAAFSTDSERWVDLTAELADVAPRAILLGRPIDSGGVFLVFALGPGDRSYFLVYNPPPLGKKPTLFVPDVSRDGDVVRMPITFPDGSEAMLSYPIALDLATLGVQSNVSYIWKENPPPRFPIRFLHEPDASIAEYVEGSEPVGVVNSYRTIEIWKARGNDVERRFWLRFALPSWTVLVSVRDALTSAEQVASSLLLRETESGFPIALASGPIELSDESGEGEGPELSIASVEGIISLFPEGCSGDPSGELAPSHQHFSRCFDGRVAMTVAGDPPFVSAVSDGVEVTAYWPVEPTPFVPEGSVADGIARVPVTFPDGSSATLVYRSTFGLVDYGVQPDNAYVLPGELGPTPIMFVHGSAGVERNYIVGAGPVTHVIDPSGERLQVWRALRISGQMAPSHWLLRRVGQWAVLVGLPEERWAEEVADSIVVHLDETGMPWVEARGRFESSGSAGEGGGAQLTIGDRDPTPRSLLPASEFFVTVELDPFGCMKSQEDSFVYDTGEAYAVLCVAGGNVLAVINGDQTVVESLVGSFEVTDFRAGVTSFTADGNIRT